MSNRVFIYTYDIGQTILGDKLSFYLKKITKVDILHSSLVCYDKEFYIWNGRINCTDIGEFSEMYGYQIKERVPIGKTRKNPEKFMFFLNGISRYYNSNTYDLVRNNCNHFSNHCLYFLLKRELPDTIMRPFIIRNKIALYQFLKYLFRLRLGACFIRTMCVYRKYHKRKLREWKKEMRYRRR